MMTKYMYEKSYMCIFFMYEFSYYAKQSTQNNKKKREIFRLPSMCIK